MYETGSNWLLECKTFYSIVNAFFIIISMVHYFQIRI